MGFLDHFTHHSDAYDTVEKAGHKASLSHELIAGAAAFEAAKAYEKHNADNGKPANHAKAVELMSALTAAYVDRLVETKGLDYVDKAKVKHEAKKHAEEALTQEY